MNNLPVFSYYSYTAPGVPPEPYLDRAWTAALVLVVHGADPQHRGAIVASRFGRRGEKEMSVTADPDAGQAMSKPENLNLYYG